MTREEKIDQLEIYLKDLIRLAKEGKITLHEIEVNRESKPKLVNFIMEQIPTGRETLTINYHVQR